MNNIIFVLDQRVRCGKTNPLFFTLSSPFELQNVEEEFSTRATGGEATVGLEASEERGEEEKRSDD